MCLIGCQSAPLRDRNAFKGKILVFFSCMSQSTPGRIRYAIEEA